MADLEHVAHILSGSISSDNLSRERTGTGRSSSSDRLKRQQQGRRGNLRQRGHKRGQSRGSHVNLDRKARKPRHASPAGSVFRHEEPASSSRGTPRTIPQPSQDAIPNSPSSNSTSRSAVSALPLVLQASLCSTPSLWPAVLNLAF